jgi:hypothetical protein
MAKIAIKLDHTLLNGETITFTAPCDCTAVDGITVTYPTENLDGSLAERTAEFVFCDAHKNNIAGIGNLFAAGATVKAVLNTNEGAAYLQNADTNAYLESKFAEVITSINTLTPGRIGAAASSVVDIPITLELHVYTEPTIAEVTAKLYTTGKLFVLDIPEYESSADKDVISYSAIPEGYRVLDAYVQHSYTYLNGLANFGINNVNKDAKTITFSSFPTNSGRAPISIRLYGVVDGDSGAAGDDTDAEWVQTVIDAALSAETAAQEAKAGTAQFETRLNSLDSGLSEAQSEIDALYQTQGTMYQTLDVAASEMVDMKQDIEYLKEHGGGGSGGGGGSTNNAVMSLQNTSGWIYKTVSVGGTCLISFTWSSIEAEMYTGPGVLKITNNGTQKYLATVEQGTVEDMDIGAYLNAGSNSIKVTITDAYGNTRSIAFNVTAVALSLTSEFDNTVPYTGGFNYVYTPTGAATKTVHFVLDGTELPTATVTVSGRQQTQRIPAQEHGSHTLEVYFEAVIEGETVPSNKLFYDIICLEDGNTTPVIAVDYNGKTAEQYDSIVIPYRVYDPTSMTAAITLSAPDMADKPLTVDRTVQKWTYRADTAGDQSLTITCGSTVKTIDLTITESSIDVEAETENLALYLSSYGRSNNEAVPNVWQSGSVAATFENYNFVSDGWITDKDGITALRTTGDARLTIPLKIFEKDFRSTGKTIELEFATRDILNYDSVILSCFSDNRGLQLTAQRALLKSEASAISTQYKEDEHVRLSFVVQKRSAYRLLQVYINGILSGVVQYPDDDDFSQSNPVNITVGSNDCTIDLYSIRVYDNDLTRFQVLDNWIADTQLATLKNERWKQNNVFDEYGQIVIGQLPQDLPYLILNAKTLPEYKGNKITVSGEYVDPVDSKRSFTFTGAEADVQGTSSAEYARKNYKIKFKGGFTQGSKTSPNYQLREDSVPTNVFTFKADVASSEGANNVELVKLYNDACPYKTPPQLEDNTVRQGIDGYPIVIFQNNGTDTVFIGKYNFNNDKATPEVFGFTEDDESWEIRNNTSDRVIWKNDDFSGTDWLNDFEGRHPDGNTDSTNLAALSAWIKSTDTTGLSETEKAARLEKFKNELPNWMDVNSTLFYYLFTELFLMVDSRAKNAFPTKYNGGVWCWLPYDMDTAIGINNEGALTFGYQLEDTDKTSTGADVYNGQDSVLWNNVREAFKDELMAMYKELRSNNAISYADTEARFENHQSKWSAAIFNEDAYYKYLEPLFTTNTASYLGMLQGSKAEQRKWWLYNRFRYMDSKYNAGDALKDVITVRGYAKSDITVTPYADIYATIKYGSYLVQKRALRGSSYTLECPLSNVNDTETYIYSASQLADVGDLSGYMVGYADFANGTKLQSLKLGDASASYSNANLIELYLGNNTLLKTLDVRNCPNLGIGANEEGSVQQTVDISGCTNIEHIYFDGTSIKGLTLPNGGVIKSLHLPGTITNLTVRNQGAITDFVLPDYSNITTLRLENVSAAVPTYDLLMALPANSRVRLVGFDWSLDGAADIIALCDYLDTMRGLDENGNNADKAQVSGIVRVENITGSQLAVIKERYPDIHVVYENIVSYLYFYDDMGENLLHTAEVVNGGDGAYTGATPTKDSTAQYNYTFAGWSKSVGGAVDADALENVIADRSVYAVFTSEIRSYTIRFYNGNTLLQTSTVPYGEMPVYTGAEPTPAVDYKFVGWTPEIAVVTGNTDYVARFVSTKSVTRSIIDKTIEEYSDDEIESIGNSAFQECSALTSVNIPNVTSIGENAFASSGLTSIDIPKVTSLGGSAFNRCMKLVSVNLPNVTSLDSSSTFGSCSALTSVDMPKVTIIKTQTFYSCVALASVNIPNVTSIEDQGFYNCRQLVSIDLPNVTSIKENGFAYCVALTSVRLPKNPPSLTNTNAFTGINSGCVFYVPTGSLSLYENATNWGAIVNTYSFVEEDR